MNIHDEPPVNEWVVSHVDARYVAQDFEDKAADGAEEVPPGTVSNAEVELDGDEEGE